MKNTLGVLAFLHIMVACCTVVSCPGNWGLTWSTSSCTTPFHSSSVAFSRPMSTSMMRRTDFSVTSLQVDGPIVRGPASLACGVLACGVSTTYARWSLKYDLLARMASAILALVIDMMGRVASKW